MKLNHTSISGVFIVHSSKFYDDRGLFCETYKKTWFEEMGIHADFVQDNRSQSRHANTIRGLHYQLLPFAQTKLISVAHGRIYDVVVDLRKSSETFGHHVALELSAEGGEQLFIPAGFAHGFCTLEPDTVVTYKVDAPYSPRHERGIHWRSPGLGIKWPCESGQAVLSEKDGLLPDQIDPDVCFA